MVAAVTTVQVLHCLPKKMSGILSAPSRACAYTKGEQHLVLRGVWDALRVCQDFGTGWLFTPLLLGLADIKLPYSDVSLWSPAAPFPNLLFKKRNWKKARNSRV